MVVRHGPGDAQAADQVRRALRAAVRAAERWGTLAGPLTITIHPTHEALEAAAHRPDRPWLRAWSRVDSVELQSPRTWSRGEATDDELTQILTHELTHCVMFQAIGGEARPWRTIPLWFKEGMATSNAGEHFVIASAPLATGDALTVPVHVPVKEEHVVGAPGLGRGGPDDASRAYAMADRAFRFLLERYGEARIRGVLARMRGGKEFADAFREAMGVPVEAFGTELTSTLSRQALGG